MINLTTIFALIGAFSVILILGLLVQEFLDRVNEKYRYKKWEQKYKHRFDKSPTAACYCKDCVYYGGKTFDNQCYRHDRWIVVDDSFCWEAKPRKHDPEEEENG